MRSSSTAGRAVWGIADQAFSSLTNFALSAVVARHTSPAGFGAFALIFSTYVLALGIARTMTTLPIVVRYSAVEVGEWRSATASASGASLVVGCLGAMVCGAVGLIVAPVRLPLFALAISLPGLMVQETWRHAFIARGTPLHAFLNDLVWAIILVPAMFAAVAVSDDPAPYVLAWGVSGSIAALVGLAQARVIPQPRASFRWIRSHWDLSSRAVGEFVVNTGSTQIVIYAAGAISGLTAAAALRGGQVLLGPLNTAFQGIWIVGLAEFVRIQRWRPNLFTRVAVGLSVLLGVGAIAYTALFLMFGGTLGPLVLGATWEKTQPVLLPLSLGAIAWGLWMGATIGLRALQEFGLSLRARTVVSVMNVVGGVTGAVVAGARGAAWGLGSTYLVGVVIWWHEFAVARRGQRPTGTPAAELAFEREVDRAAEEAV